MNRKRDLDESALERKETLSEYRFRVENTGSKVVLQVFYVIFLIIHSSWTFLVIIMSILDACFEGFNTLLFFYCILNTLFIISSVAYVFYPDSTLGRHLIIKVGIMGNLIGSIILLLTVFIMFLNNRFISHKDWEDSFDGYMYIYIVIISIMLIAPIVHAILTLIIWRNRGKIARAQSELILDDLQGESTEFDDE